MKKFVPHKLSISTITPPASKSYAQRAIMAASLCDEPTLLKNLGSSDDVRHILGIAKQIGAELEGLNDGIRITPKSNPLQTNLNCGESGLGIRMTTPILTTFGKPFKIQAKGSLLNRPLHEFETILPQIGVELESNNGLAPLAINGTIKGGTIQVDGSLSSQYITGLLMALPLADEDSLIQVHQPTSVPYLKMTIDLLSDFGIEIEHEDFQEFKIRGKQKYRSPGTYQIENDWSAAAFWVVYGAIKQRIEIQSLNPDSAQADKEIISIVEQAGAAVHWKQNTLIIEPQPLSPIHVDATQCPDLFPILATLCMNIHGRSKIKGIQRLTHKESNRAKTIQSEFHKLGVPINLKDDFMIFEPHHQLISNEVTSHNDHRIAMALAIAASTMQEGIYISSAEAVNKSYPDFWADLSL